MIRTDYLLVVLVKYLRIKGQVLKICANPIFLLSTFKKYIEK